MSKEEIAEFEVLSDEEMEGAVHVDGLLRMEKRALRGRDRNKRKRRRKGEDDNGSPNLESDSDEQSEGQVIKRENGESSGDEYS